MKSETGENWITYHHNWFDHSDSRMARVRTMSVHMYNNYYQHNDVYGIGATSGSSIFMESNYFDAVKRPIMSSLQGTDAMGDGTFSGEKGGLIKAYGNVFANKPANFSYIPYAENNTSFDAYEVSNPSEQVPASVKTLVGGTSYDNFDTNPSLMYAYAADKAEDVPSIVEGFYGAGRLNHGDIDFVIPDETVVTNGHQQPWPALASLLDAYTSGVVKVFGESDGGTVNPTPDPTPDPTPGPTPGPDAPVIEGTVTCSFATDGTLSNTSFALTGEAKNVKKEETVIDGTTYTASLKMESKTEVSFTTSQKMTLYVYYGLSGTNTNVKVDGVKQTGAPTTVVLEAGAHKITKGDSTTVALIKLVPVTE